MSELLRITFPMPKRCDGITSIEVRECNGIDEQQASLAAEGSPTTAYIEMVRLSITAINGKSVVPPGSAPVEQWKSRTRKAALFFFDRMNDCADEELGPLAMKAEIDAGIEAVAESESPAPSTDTD